MMITTEYRGEGRVTLMMEDVRGLMEVGRYMRT